ncbi:hypothetical protein TMatcc_008364 [Talaromyces marneffei ATCC 18224]
MQAISYYLEIQFYTAIDPRYPRDSAFWYLARNFRLLSILLLISFLSLRGGIADRHGFTRCQRPPLVRPFRWCLLWSLPPVRAQHPGQTSRDRTRIQAQRIIDCKGQG